MDQNHGCRSFKIRRGCNITWVAKFQEFQDPSRSRLEPWEEKGGKCEGGYFTVFSRGDMNHGQESHRSAYWWVITLLSTSRLEPWEEKGGKCEGGYFTVFSRADMNHGQGSHRSAYWWVLVGWRRKVWGGIFYSIQQSRHEPWTIEL